jgi:hypothetical protein
MLSTAPGIAAAFLDLLIFDSFCSPHKLSDRCISKIVSISPSDAPECAVSEPQLPVNILNTIQALPFIDLKEITEGAAVIDL